MAGGPVFTTRTRPAASAALHPDAGKLRDETCTPTAAATSARFIGPSAVATAAQIASVSLSTAGRLSASLGRGGGVRESIAA